MKKSIGTIKRSLALAMAFLLILGVTPVLTVYATSKSTILVLDISKWDAKAEKSTNTVKIRSNVSWTVKSSASSWLKVSPSSGKNDGSFTITAEANTKTASRSGTITISGGGTSHKITVTQAGLNLAKMKREQRDKRVPTGEMMNEMVKDPMGHMVLIEGGTYTRGLSTKDGGDLYTVPHKVEVKSFYMSIYEVTQREFMEVIPKGIPNESTFRGDKYELKGNNRPAENVRWIYAIEYCNALSEKHKLTPAYKITRDKNGNATGATWNRNADGYRLPTEAEWEYACRAGTTTVYNTGAKAPTESQAAFDAKGGGNTKKGTHSSTVPVGSYKSNAWGLYDMTGNVWEWCWDWYGKYPVVKENHTLTNAIGPSAGQFTRHQNKDPEFKGDDGKNLRDTRVMRGGSWNSSVFAMGSHFRASEMPLNAFHAATDDSYEGQIGFRIVRNAP
jgi:formylglycine-generating enzyme required for sulfatase activity